MWISKRRLELEKKSAINDLLMDIILRSKTKDKTKFEIQGDERRIKCVGKYELIARKVKES